MAKLRIIGSEIDGFVEGAHRGTALEVLDAGIAQLQAARAAFAPSNDGAEFETATETNGIESQSATEATPKRTRKPKAKKAE